MKHLHYKNKKVELVHKIKCFLMNFVSFQIPRERCIRNSASCFPNSQTSPLPYLRRKAVASKNKWVNWKKCKYTKIWRKRLEKMFHVMIPILKYFFNFWQFLIFSRSRSRSPCLWLVRKNMYLHDEAHYLADFFIMFIRQLPTPNACTQM